MIVEKYLRRQGHANHTRLAITMWFSAIATVIFADEPVRPSRRCIRKAFLLSESEHNRKDWFENRLEELADILAVPAGGFSVIDLNPVTAKFAEALEASGHTSIKQRLEPVEAQGKTTELAAAEGGPRRRCACDGLP
jgi:hypothetical protein